MMVLISMYHQLGVLILKIFYKQEIVYHYNLSFYDIRYNIFLGNYILSFMEIFGFVFFPMITGFLSFQFKRCFMIQGFLTMILEGRCVCVCLCVCMYVCVCVCVCARSVMSNSLQPHRL